MRRALTLAGAIVIAVALLVTPATAAVKKKTFKNPTTLGIPDASPSSPGIVLQTLKVKTPGLIRDLKIGIQVTHPNTCNLELWLGKKDKWVQLASRNCAGPSPQANFGGGTGCAGPLTVFDDAAPLPIFAGSNPFAGSFPPTNVRTPLSVLEGERLNGRWKLVAIDFSAGNTGTLNCFQLNAKYQVG